MLGALSKKGSFTEIETVRALRGVIDALRYCHENAVVHRDIKLENIFFDTVDSNSIVKVGDFGFARLFNKEDKMMTTLCGTLAYTGRPVSNSPRDHR